MEVNIIKKEYIKERYKVLEINPSRKLRLESLISGKIIKVTNYRTMYYKLDKYYRLCFSSTGHPSSYHPFNQGFNYTDILDDLDSSSNSQNIVEIIEEFLSI
jgi:hypothetical protein